jgi:serine/threonine protein kinase/hemoglobin-like flavoprotein
MSEDDKERKLFGDCLELSEEEREAYLNSNCQGDPGLKKRVLLLLRYHQEATEAGVASQIFGSWIGNSNKFKKEDIAGKPDPVSKQDNDTEKDSDKVKNYCGRCETSLGKMETQCENCGRRRPENGWPHDSRLQENVAGGQYRVVRRLGSGGFGVVYEVETVVGGLKRALKVLKEHWIENRSVRERFINEALLLEQINHPNVARCYSAGTLEDGELYLLFEFIDGVPLSNILNPGIGKSSTMDPLRAVRISKQIASGLVAAHAKQVLHRDLKPANLLIIEPGSSSEKVKLLDFGVAKLIDVDWTATGELIGTPAYMAPEQFLPDLPVGTGVDLWQLGAVMFTMLTGRSPYAESANSVDDIVGRFAARGLPGPAPSEVNPDLSAHPLIDKLVSLLLATSPSDRPDSAAEVCQELARIEQSLSPSSKSARPALLDALCAQPSENSWTALCRYLVTQDEEIKQVAEEMLSSWPTQLRRATVYWWENTRRGESHPLWRLARSLDLSGRGLTDKDIESLAGCPALSSLRSLNLADNEIGPEGVNYLAQSPFVSSLEQLDFSNNRIRSKGVEFLTKSTHLKRLKSLNLSRNHLTAGGVESLLRSELPLRHLDLSDNDLRTEGAEALSRGAIKTLESLVLRGNLFGPDGIAVLAVSSLFDPVRKLDLARNTIGPSGAAALAVSKNLRRLRTLVLGQNNLSRQGMELLLSSSGLETLESLDISSNSLGPNGAMALASSRLARRLRSLDIADNRIEDAGLASLIGTPQLTGLSFLRIAQNGLTPSGISLFDGSALQLEMLDLSNNPLGAQGVTQLSAAINKVRVNRLIAQHISISGEFMGELVKSGRGNIVCLDASNNDLGIDGIESLSRTAESVSIRDLSLDRTWSGAEGVKAIVSSPNMINIIKLSISSNQIGDSGLMELVSRTGLTNLQDLSIQDNRIGGEGAAILAASPLATRLKKLNISYNRLGDIGAEALAHGPGWQQLQDLVLKDNEIGFGGAAALFSASGMEMLQSLDLTGNPLRGNLDVHSLAEDKVAVLESTFGKISIDGKHFADRFYEELFQSFPGVKPLFANTTMSRQKQHLFSALALVIENIRKPDAVEKSLTELGKRHVGYGVTPSQYYAVSTTLLNVIRETLGEDWSDTAQDAWSDGLEAICRVMMNAHRQTSQTE